VSTEIKRVLIRTLLRLLADRSIDGISVRKVARAARLNHGLVHRHFGSKEGLLRAAVAQLGRDLHAGSRSGLTSRTFAFLRRYPWVARVAARACLDGPHDLLPLAAPTQEELFEILFPLQRAADALGVKPATLNALATAALIGWFVFRPLLENYGLPADADDQVARLAALADQLASSRDPT
jgi:TetR/AcrR family transcriptional regulator, repressor for neighboring sulfatase